MSAELYKILLVEDNAGDVMLIHECLRMTQVPFELTRCDTIKMALTTISRYSSGDPDVPDLLLLDYNLPAGEASEVLLAARANPALARTRKAVITSSLSPRDHEDALKSGAECVISKPADLDLFLDKVGEAILALLGRTKTTEESKAGALQ